MPGRRVAAIRILTAIVVAALLPAGAADSASPSYFSSYLAKGYHQLAVAAAKAKAPLADFYKTRSAVAAAGGEVKPLEPDPKNLHGLMLTAALQARDDLIDSLGRGARDRQPLLAAIAQVNFDCWVMPLPRHKGAPSANDCHSRFYFALEGLPAAKRRGPIASVEAWQVTGAPGGDVVAMDSSPASSGIAGIEQSADPIGSLIHSLSVPSLVLPPRSTPFDASLSAVVLVSSEPLPAAPQADSDLAAVVVGSCQGRCLPLDFVGADTWPLIQTLRREREETATLGGSGHGVVGAGSSNTSSSSSGSSNSSGTAGGGALGGSSNSGGTPGGEGTVGGGTSGGSSSTGGPSSGGTPGGSSSSSGGTTGGASSSGGTTGGGSPSGGTTGGGSASGGTTGGGSPSGGKTGGGSSSGGTSGNGSSKGDGHDHGEGGD